MIISAPAVLVQALVAEQRTAELEELYLIGRVTGQHSVALQL